MDKELRRLLRPVLLLVLLIFVFAEIFYVLCQVQGRDVSYLRCLYMVVITISTIGYEDMIQTTGSRILSVVNITMILVSMVIVTYAISNFTAFLVEGHLEKYFLRKSHLKRIRKMEQHYIVCGIKDIGIFVAKELFETKRPFVVIEESSAAIEALSKEIPSLVVIEGDATDDHLLTQAGISRACGLVACLDNDKENLYLVMAARELNKGLQIAAKFNSPKNRQKLLKSGASCLVSPNMIGGMRIASELFRPQVVGFLDKMLRSKSDAGVRVEELVIPEDSPLIGRTLLDIYRQTGILVISVYDLQENDYQYNPGPDQPVTAGVTLIYIASPDQRLTLEKTCGVKTP
jgi:voltage-gated potassium channel